MSRDALAQVDGVNKIVERVVAGKPRKGLIWHFQGSGKSLREGATKELHFEPRLVDLHIDQKAIEETYAELTAGLTDEDRDRLEEDLDRGKAALTQLFEEAKNSDTPIMVRRVVDDIDEIVRAVRFDGWQATHAGEREVKKALRQTLFKYKLHQDTDLFDRAYGYIREYY
jgi:hypothetical protein